MMWADRVGVGSAALLLIGLLYAGCFDDSGEQREKQDATYETAAANCAEWAAKPPVLPNPKLGKDEPDVDYLYDRYARPKCPPEKPEEVTGPNYWNVGYALFLYAVLPLWLVLRVIDFMFGGPAHRRA